MTIDDTSVTRGEHWYQALLDTESRPVPDSLRATSVGPLEGVDIAPSPATRTSTRSGTRP